MKRKDLKKGGTLIELLLYTSLIGTILTSLSVFLIIVLEDRVKNTLVQEVYGQANFVTEVINQNIRNAESIVGPTDGNNANSLSIVVSGDSVVFDLDSGILRMTEGGGSPINLTNEDLVISNLDFHNLTSEETNGLIQTSFDIAGSSASNRQEFNYDTSIQTSAGLRVN